MLRNLKVRDLLLPHSQRISVINNPELAKLGVEVVFTNSHVRILGLINPSNKPPTPRSPAYLVGSPNHTQLKLSEEFIIGKHEYSGMEVPMLIDALKYYRSDWNMEIQASTSFSK